MVCRIKENNLTPFGKVAGIIKRVQRNYCGHVEFD